MPNKYNMGKGGKKGAKYTGTIPAKKSTKYHGALKGKSKSKRGY